jgi:hypothetical protein
VNKTANVERAAGLQRFKQYLADKDSGSESAKEYIRTRFPGVATGEARG